MTPLYSDTHPRMEALQIGLWRQASPTRKMQMLAQLNAAARTRAPAGLRSRFPNANEAELRYRLAVLSFGEELAQKSMEIGCMQNEPLEVTFKVTSVFEKLGVPYLISGSLASTLYGSMAWCAQPRIQILLRKCDQNTLRRSSPPSRMSFIWTKK